MELSSKKTKLIMLKMTVGLGLDYIPKVEEFV